MTIKHRRSLLLATSLGLVLAGQAALADATTVHISLWDNGPMAMDPLGTMPGMGMHMHGANMSMATMGITVDQNTIPAGEVTLDATNDSGTLVHEMLISPVPADGAPLPYDQGAYRVDEEAAMSLGEVSELEPGDSGALTVMLDPGQYVLYCNVPGHYEMGMWTVITVTG